MQRNTANYYTIFQTNEVLFHFFTLESIDVMNVKFWWGRKKNTHKPQVTVWGT